MAKRAAEVTDELGLEALAAPWRSFKSCRLVDVTGAPSMEAYVVGRTMPGPGGVGARLPVKIEQDGTDIVIEFDGGLVSRFVNVPVELEYETDTQSGGQ